MKIETGQVHQGLLDVGQKSKTTTAERATADVRGEVSRSGDEVALSSRLRQIRELAGEVEDVRGVDQQAVADLRSQIVRSEFGPSSDAIAAALFGAVSNGGGA